MKLYLHLIFCFSFQNNGASQFFIDAWEGTTSTLPECDSSGNR